MNCREELEEIAKDVGPAELWYELQDTIEETPDADLIKIVEDNQ